MPVALILGAAAVVGYSYDSISVHAAAAIHSVAAMFVGSGCDIKGNISINTGERIYHVPGQRYYAATRISPQYGERWFCSEADARAAGWRRARW